MMIVETCPRCGADLVSFLLTCDPPIPQKACHCCGWRWTGEPEEVVRIPFGGNSYAGTNTTYLDDGYQADNVPMTRITKAVRHNPVQLSDSGYDSSPCRTCSNNPANGGSGICLCTLGQPEFT